MWFFWILFFFIALGAKVLLAFVMVYLLLPSDGRCARCDADTLLLKPGWFGRIGTILTFGRAQWRWCPRCGTEGFAQRTKQVPPPAAGMSPRKVRTRTRS
jgi:hypothetical protein